MSQLSKERRIDLMLLAESAKPVFGQFSPDALSAQREAKDNFTRQILSILRPEDRQTYNQIHGVFMNDTDEVNWLMSLILEPPYNPEMDDGYPESIFHCDYNEIPIYNPYKSPCSRFAVNPQMAYPGYNQFLENIKSGRDSA